VSGGPSDGLSDADLLARWLDETVEGGGSTFLMVFRRYREVVRADLERFRLPPLEAIQRVATVFYRTQDNRPEPPADTPLRERSLIVAREVAADPD
jgi:hypothetical protein